MNIKFWSFLFLSFQLIGCHEQRNKSSQSNNTNDIIEIPQKIVLKSTIKYNHEVSLWTLNTQPYSGFAVSYYSNGTLKEKFGIFHGKKQNEAMQWFNDGHLKNVTNYHQGKLHGEKKLWSSDSTHILIAKFNYDKGKAHGEQKKWYSSGELYKKMNLNRGKEEGIQQAFRKNGALYANYEAKEGRIFGLKKTKLCYGLQDENIKYEH